MLQLRPTFSESWYRVVSLKPRLRPSAQISRQYYRGERWYVVRDPAGNQFHRLSDAAYRFVGLLDGRRTVGECWDLVGGQLEDDAPTQPEVIQILSQLYAANLIETDISPDATVLLRRHKVQMQRRMQGRLMNLLFPRIPIWDCDRFLVRWMPVVSKLLSKWGAIVWLAVVIAALVVVLPRYSGPDGLKEAAKNSIDPKNWLWLWATFVFIKFIHECGHAFACRRFGGEVHEMGIMFLVFIPTPYVDASTAWAFPSKWARMFVGAAGMIVEIFFAAICAFIWANTNPNTLINQLSYNAMLIASVSTVLFNANPLLRYDGYYMLSDFLEIPNLQQKSREYMWGLIKRHVFRIKATQPLPPPWQRAQLLIYAILSGIYRVFIGILIIVVVAFQVPILGVLMALAGIVTWVVAPIFKLLKYLLLEPELHRKRGRAWAFCGAVAAALIILLGLVRFPMGIYADGVIEPKERQIVRVETPGFVKEVVAQDNQPVKVGDVLLVLSDDGLQAEIQQKLADIKRLEARKAWAQVNDPNQAMIADEAISSARRNLEDLRRRETELTIKAEIDGYVVAPQLHQLQGRYLQKGDEVAIVAQLDKLMVYAAIDQRDAALLFGNRRATEVRLVSRPNMPLYASHATANPAAVDRLRDPALGMIGGGSIAVDPSDPSGLRPAIKPFELRAELENPTGEYIPGQRAHVRVVLDNRSIGYQALRRFLQVLQAKSGESEWL
jgi:putative peptide zinc metalloprotease protein